MLKDSNIYKYRGSDSVDSIRKILGSLSLCVIEGAETHKQLTNFKQLNNEEDSVEKENTKIFTLFF
ncbi:hypothetical protein CWI38_0464p0030 [Hamiltosporidium tvaerminnensis]|uniref:Uncharacterized protein n=2 Tax=Hamiltosporidium TaxID=1176354 RepID=A0A4Q9L128_9MICR|nr:hypothetical protein CWI39_1606p0010 [Hamiltosporidium magnivora]TBU13334.1 hypothetical protein CWI38_0464p0030 [Hamiltosporidium tvaerminnensis]